MTAESSDTLSGTRLTVASEPRPEDVKFKEHSLHAFKAFTTGILDGKLFGLFARVPDGSPFGGALGWIWGGTCQLRYLIT
jgi:hypothetical protein